MGGLKTIETTGVPEVQAAIFTVQSRPGALPNHSHFLTPLLHVHIPTSLYFQVSVDLFICDVSSKWNHMTCRLL